MLIWDGPKVKFADPGSRDDPNELAFKKGQTLHVLDKSGKWWLARAKDGRKGSRSLSDLFTLVNMPDFSLVAPSNYLRLLE